MRKTRAFGELRPDPLLELGVCPAFVRDKDDPRPAWHIEIKYGGWLLCSGRESSWRCSKTLPVLTLKIGADPVRWYRGARSGGVPAEDDDAADANTGPPSV